MKKLISMIYAVTAVSLLTVPAMADVIVPIPAAIALELGGPLLVISVIIIAVIILLKKK